MHLLVIGAGPGLSAAIAERFAREGFSITLAVRTEERLIELAAKLQNEGANVDTLVADAVDVASFRDALEAYAETHAPSVVVYNAARLAPNHLLETSASDIADAYAIDVIGAFSAAQVFTPAMRAAHRGTYLITGGALAYYPQPLMVTLSLGKAGDRVVGAVLHAELAVDNVHAASVTITGQIAPGGADLLAEELDRRYRLILCGCPLGGLFVHRNVYPSR